MVTNIKQFFIGRLTGSFDRPSVINLYDSITGESFFKIEYYQNGSIRVESSIIDVYDYRYNTVKGHIMASIPIWKEISLSPPDIMYDYQEHIGHLIQSIEREDKLNQLFEEEEHKPRYKHTTRWI